MTFLPQDYKVTQAINPQVGAAGAVTSDAVSLKHVKRLWLIVDITDAAGNALLLTPQRCTDVAGTGAAVLANNVKIWSNVNTALTDTLVRVADALNFTTAATATNKQVVFQIDPASLGGVNDCFRLVTGAVNANSTISAVFVAEIRYPQATPPSIILD
jgi:hypothetical protein